MRVSWIIGLNGFRGIRTVAEAAVIATPTAAAAEDEKGARMSYFFIFSRSPCVRNVL